MGVEIPEAFELLGYMDDEYLLTVPGFYSNEEELLGRGVIFPVYRLKES